MGEGATHIWPLCVAAATIPLNAIVRSCGGGRGSRMHTRGEADGGRDGSHRNVGRWPWLGTWSAAQRPLRRAWCLHGDASSACCCTARPSICPPRMAVGRQRGIAVDEREDGIDLEVFFGSAGTAPRMFRGGEGVLFFLVVSVGAELLGASRRQRKVADMVRAGDGRPARAFGL